MINDIVKALDKVLLGKHDCVELLIMALLADGHVLIEDVPGTGKTTLAKALALSLGAEFSRIQFTPDLLPADVTGGAIYKANKGDFEIRKGPVFTQLLLADEINRASPRTQSALLEAMEEHQVSLEGEMLQLPKFFMVLATQNPVEFHGVYPLPEAEMDRFLIRISIGYPSEETELDILRTHRKMRPLDGISQVSSVNEILDARECVKNIHVDPSLEKYVISLVQATRVDARFRLPASPRAGLGLVRMAQSSAFLDSRDYVNPDDIQRVFFPVMEHRVFVKDPNSSSSAEALHSILKNTKIPK